MLETVWVDCVSDAENKVLIAYLLIVTCPLLQSSCTSTLHASLILAWHYTFGGFWIYLFVCACQLLVLCRNWGNTGHVCKHNFCFWLHQCWMIQERSIQNFQLQKSSEIICNFRKLIRTMQRMYSHNFFLQYKFDMLHHFESFRPGAKQCSLSVSVRNILLKMLETASTPISTPGTLEGWTTVLIAIWVPKVTSLIRNEELTELKELFNIKTNTTAS